MICVRNELDYIPKCIEHLRNQIHHNQHFSYNLEQVIVYDDDSTDGTQNFIDAISNIFDEMNVIHGLKPEKQGHFYAKALFNASEQLHGCDYIGLLDADTVLTPEYYLKILYKMEQDHTIGLAGGQVVNDPSQPFIYGLPPIVAGSNRVYSKDLWLKLNKGSLELRHQIESIDTYHYLQSFLYGYNPTMFEEIRSWSLRSPNRNRRRMFNRGYDCYQLGYYGYFMLLRALKNRSPAMLAGYCSAWVNNTNRLAIEPYVKFCQRKKLLNAIGVKTDLPETDPITIIKQAARRRT